MPGRYNPNTLIVIDPRAGKLNFQQFKVREPSRTANEPAMHRFYCPNLATVTLNAPANDSSGNSVTVTLDDDEAHHARRVLRLKAGDSIELFDGKGTTASASISDWQDGATVCVTSSFSVSAPKPQVVIASAVPKGPHAEDMVNQLCQVGADVLIPLTTARSVVDPRDKKLAKFQRIAIEAAKQCGRAHLMIVDPVRSLADTLARFALENATDTCRLIAAPDGQHADVSNLRTAGTVVILIGPEGGWADEELHEADVAGFARWSLGPHIMRIETAAVAAAAIVRYSVVNP